MGIDVVDAPPRPRETTGARRVAHALARDGRAWTGALIVVVLAAVAVAPGAFGADALGDCHLSRSLDPPSAAHWFGFDVQGCDYYTLTLHGARSSLGIGAAVVAASLVIGGALGLVAGYVRGAVDAVLSRVAEVWLAVPAVFAGLAVLSVLDRRGVLQVVIVLVLLAWPALMRVTRAAVVQLAAAPHVEAARAIGASSARILTRHVLPFAVWPAVVYATTSVAAVISAEAVLSFMGVGLQLPAVSWGLLLADASPRVARAPHLLLPGAFLTAAAAAFVLLGEALRRAADTRADQR